jgi:hypothetical protein
MMVKGDPAAVGTMLLPFMRSNCIYTSDIAMVPYPGYHNMRPDIGHFSLDDESCVGLDIAIASPSQRLTYGSKQAFPTPRIG